MPREQGPCAPPVRTRSSRVAAASNRASLRRRQAESSEAEHRARELMVLMEAELEKVRGRGHAAAPRRAWSSRTSGSTAGSRGPGMSTSVVVMTARTRSRLTTTSATRRRRCVRRWRSWRRSAGRRLPATTSARHYRGPELARQLDSSPSLPTSSRPLAVSAPLVLRRGGRPRRVRAPPAAGPAAHELRQPRAPRTPPARSAGRGRRVRAPPPPSLPGPAVRVRPAFFPPSREKWVEERERRIFASRSSCDPKWVGSLGHRLETGLVTQRHCCDLFLDLPILVGDSLRLGSFLTLDGIRPTRDPTE